MASEGDEWKRHRKICAPSFSEPNNRLVWDETVSVMNDLFSTLWKDKQEIVSENALEITMPVSGVSTQFVTLMSHTNDTMLLARLVHHWSSGIRPSYVVDRRILSSSRGPDVVQGMY